MRALTLTLLTSTLLASCAMPAPQPQAPLRPRLDLPLQWQTATMVGGGDPAHWWQGFKDPLLERLLADAAQANPDILIAIRRLQISDDALRITDSQRAMQLAIGATPVDAATAASTRRSGVFSLGVSASYALDFWGRIGAEVSAASALKNASASDLATVSLTLQQQLAHQYFALCALDALLPLQAARVQMSAERLRLTRLRTDAGRSDGASVAAAGTALASAEAAQRQQVRERATAQMQLALLLGQAPETLVVPSTPPSATAALPEVPAGLPASLISHRPDLVAAEYRLQAAHADVAAARAAVMPQLSLTAELGVVTGPLRQFVSGSRALFGIGPEFNYLLHDGGRGAAQIDASEQERQIALLNYRKAVVAALADVERALLAREAALDESRKLAAEAASIAQQAQWTAARSAAGRSSRFEALALQAQALDLQASQISNRRAQRDSLLDLYAALGGSWQDSAITAASHPHQEFTP